MLPASVFPRVLRSAKQQYAYAPCLEAAEREHSKRLQQREAAAAHSGRRQRRAGRGNTFDLTVQRTVLCTGAEETDASAVR